MQAAEIARIQKMKMLQQRKLHKNLPQENNLRTSRLMERKKDKKKNGKNIMISKQFQTVEGDEDDVDDLLKYIYEEIKQAESHQIKTKE